MKLEDLTPKEQLEAFYAAVKPETRVNTTGKVIKIKSTGYPGYYQYTIKSDKGYVIWFGSTKPIYKQLNKHDQVSVQYTVKGKGDKYFLFVKRVDIKEINNAPPKLT